MKKKKYEAGKTVINKEFLLWLGNMYMLILIKNEGSLS